MDRYQGKKAVIIGGTSGSSPVAPAIFFDFEVFLYRSFTTQTRVQIPPCGPNLSAAIFQ